VENLKQGKITIQELEMLNFNLSKTINLFSPEVAKRVTNDSSFKIADLIAQRNSEVQKFKSYCSNVRTLMEYCESFSKGSMCIMCTLG